MSDKRVFLYVEDDPFSRDIMKLLLQRGLGYEELTILEDSADFLTRVESLSPQPNIFLVDIHVQPHNGFELLKQLRAHARYSHCKVIAITASVMNEEVEELRCAGFDGGLSKPINQFLFSDVLERIMAGEEIWQIT